MRRRRVPFLASSLLVIGLIGSGGPAIAGGSWLEFPREWATVGDSVTGSSVFGTGAQADLSEGPWFAYLTSEDPDRLVYLAPVSITDATGSICCWRATVTFTVPRVEPGEYWVSVCDRGCTTGVGDLGGGPLFVAATERAGIAREIRSEARHDVRRIEQRASRAVDAAEEESEALRADRSRALLENRALRDELAGVSSELRRERDRVPGWAWLMIGAAAGAATANAVAVRRRRRPPTMAALPPSRRPAERRALVGAARP